MDCCSLTYICYGALGLSSIYLVPKLIQHILNRRKLNRWSNTKKDVIVVHGPPSGLVVPNPSPWLMKLQTYLRMANLKYELDSTDPFGPKGKTPWISYNGQSIADSQLIIEYFKKKTGNSFNHNYSEEKLAIATVVRIMLEEHLFWGLRLQLFVFGSMDDLQKCVKMSGLWMLKLMYGREIKKASWMQGIYRHSQTEIEDMMIKDLRAVSKILGNKKFICGEEPCEDDCSIFGMLSGIVWSIPTSRYGVLVNGNGELKNIKEYCLRMKERFWPDWEDCLAK